MIARHYATAATPYGVTDDLENTVARTLPFRTVRMRGRLLAIALAGILPLAVVAGLGLVQIVRDQAERAEQSSLEVTRMAATAIEVELRRSISLLEALAQSPTLEHNDLSAFADLVRRVMPLTPGWHAVLLAEPDGRVVDRISPNVITGPVNIADRDSFARLIATGSPVVGQLARGPQGSWGVPLRVPVRVDGRLRYVLTAVIAPESIRDVVTQRHLPAGWVTTVLDTTGRRIARTEQHVETLGAPASPTLAELLEMPRAEGTGTSYTIEGNPVHTAFVRMAETGWVVATGIPTTEVRQSATQAFSLYGGGLALSLLLALAAAVVAARRINRPMRQLTRAAHAMGRGHVPQIPRSDIREIQDVSQALVDAARARHTSEAERDVALVNLEHAEQALRERVNDLELLHSLNQRLLELPTLGEQMQAILDMLCAFHGADHGLVSLSDGREPLRIFASRGFSEATLTRLGEVSPGEERCGRSVSPSSRVVIADTETDPRFADCRWLSREERFRAVHSTPLLSSAGGVMGVLTVQLAESREPSPREMHMADVCAGIAAVFVERARARQQAGESEQRLRVALDSSTMPFCIIAPVRSHDGSIHDFRLDFVNQVGAKALGRPVYELIGTPVSSFAQTWRDGDVFDMCRRVVGEQHSQEIEWQALSMGCECWFHVTANPFAQGVALWFTNISQRKEQERQLKEADRRKDEFLATLAHELRNPLAPIRQAAALVGSPSATDSQKRHSQEVIERQVRHMALLLEDLLDISRITLGKIVLRREPVKLATAIEGAVQTVRAQLEAKRQRIVLPAETDLWVDADPLRVEQMLTNLLANAIKYTGQDGEIRLQVSGDDRDAQITVIDNGIGIASENLDAVFQMFVQISTATSQPSSGLGIGLALARGLARLHGGEIEVSSPGLGQGSCFTLRLPRTARPQDAAPVDAAGTFTGGIRRVLVADDNPDIAETLAELLRIEQHEVCIALDGHQALAEYERFRPDVALLDIGMPGLRGDEVARAIRALPGGGRVTLVAFTGWGQSVDKERALAAGFDRHLTKPANIEEIFAIVSASERYDAPT